MKQASRLFQFISVLVVMLLMSFTASAQTTVRGSVVDDGGEPLIGASVVMKGNPSVAAVTDLDGNFVLHVPTNKATLRITYVGMIDKEVAVVPGKQLNVTLLSDANTLNETVVVGYGQQKKASVVGSITQTTGKVLERAGGVSSLGAALTGNLPGVVTLSSTGMPGEEDPDIIIRGISSWNGHKPLIMVDGIEREMSSVDINSVASVSVLKDASATAVYGVRGANGVILITTKRGADGPAKIEVGMNMTLKSASKLPGTMRSADPLYVRNQAAEHELGVAPESWGKMTPAAILDKYRNPANLEEAERYPDVDWQSEVFKSTAMAYNPHINVSGGTKFVKYFANVDYLHEGDLFREWDNNRGYKAGYGYDRINMRANLDFDFTKTTTLKVGLNGSHGVRKGPWGTATGSFGESQLWQAAYSAPSDAFIPRYSDGTWGYYPAETQGAPNSIMNLALSGAEKHTYTKVNTDFTLIQKLDFVTKGLQVMGTVAWDNQFTEKGRGINDLYHNAQTKWINPETGEAVYGQNPDGKTNFDFQEGILWSTAGGTVDNKQTLRNMTYSLQFDWARKFGLHDLSAMLVFKRSENAKGYEFLHYREEWAARVTYNYAERYFLEVNGAYNGSEQFGDNYKFDYFPSVAVGYMISEENFFKPLKKYVDMLKFKYSYGEAGDDSQSVGRWLYATQWAYGGNINQGLESTASPYTWYKESAVGNPDIHWEISRKQNFGIEYGFLDGLITGNVDFFWDNRKDVIIDSNGNKIVPSYYGAKAPATNYGAVKSHGYEFELRLSKTFGEHHVYGNFSMTHAENKITRYTDPQLKPAYQKTAGYAINQDHSYLTTGFANTWDQVYGMTEFNTNDTQNLPGQYAIIDYNGDGVIDSNDNAPYGYSTNPQNTYNATLGWDWKGFSVRVQFYGVTNVDRYVGFNSLSKTLDTVFDEGTFWTKESQDADAPMPRINSTPSYYEGTRFHYDGSFIRLKTAELSYTFTQSWVKNLGLNSVQIYANGNNLWVWSRMPDDRESNFAGTGLASQGAYPTVKRFNLGLKVNL